MSRPTVRTESLIRDDAARIKELFGTRSNAYRMLSLENRGVPESEFRRALMYETVLPKHRESIEDAWSEWKEKYLKRPDVLSFELDDENAFTHARQQA